MNVSEMGAAIRIFLAFAVKKIIQATLHNASIPQWHMLSSFHRRYLTVIVMENMKNLYT